MLDIELFIQKINKKSRLIGIDPGGKRIGIAISDENKIVATPYTTLVKENYSKLLLEIKKIFKENEIDGIVVGNPLNMDGSTGKSSQSAADFAKKLSINVTIPISMWDERLSSEATFKITKELGTNATNRVDKLDKNAAAFILQGAIDYLSN